MAKKKELLTKNDIQFAAKVGFFAGYGAAKTGKAISAEQAWEYTQKAAELLRKVSK